DLRDDVQPGRAPVGLLPQRRTAERRRHLLGERAHEQRVGLVELVGAQVGQADHGLAPAADDDRPASARCERPSSACLPVRTTWPITPESSGWVETATVSRPRVIVHIRWVLWRWSAPAVHTAV